MTDKELQVRVMQHYQEALKWYPQTRIFGIFLQGSQNYYLDDEQSDVDTKVLVLPTLDEIVFNQKPVSTTHILDNDEHIDAKDVRLYWQCFKKGNPNFVEILFSRAYYINPRYREVWEVMLKTREMIARVHPMAAAKAMMGMVQEKHHAMEHRYPSRAHIVDKFGYDPKQLQHLIRMTWFLEAYVENIVHYEDILKLAIFAADAPPETVRKYLLDIKRGRVYSLEEAREIAKTYLQEAEEALKYAKENWPVDPDPMISAAMDNLLGEIIRSSIKMEIELEKDLEKERLER